MRSTDLQAVIDRLEQAFAGADLSAPARLALGTVFERLAKPGPAGSPKGLALAAATLLPQALAPLLGRTDALAPLAGALVELGPQIAWTVRQTAGPTASPNFPRCHSNALLIGPGALEDREDVWVGLSLMAPHTRYPDHDHPPEEVYLVLSEGAFLQGEAAWLPRKPGQTIYNTPGIRHAMRAQDKPFLALWCLPV